MSRKLDNDLKKLKPKYRFSSFCPICNNEGGVHGKCLGCGKNGNWNTVLGEEARLKKNREKKEKKDDPSKFATINLDDLAENLIPVPDPVISARRKAGPAPNAPVTSGWPNDVTPKTCQHVCLGPPYTPVSNQDYLTWRLLTSNKRAGDCFKWMGKSGWTEVQSASSNLDFAITRVILTRGFAERPILIDEFRNRFIVKHIVAPTGSTNCIVDEWHKYFMKHTNVTLLLELCCYALAVQNNSLRQPL